MCYEFLAISAFGTALSWGEGFSATGLVLDIAGIGLLSISGIIRENPIDELWRLYYDVEKDELSDESRTTGALTFKSPDEMALGTSATPQLKTKDDYDAYRSRLLRLAFGGTFLVLGLFLQFLGVLIC